MKLSKKSRYGLRALIDLAVNSRTELVSLGSIAQRNDISAQYLEHVFSALRKAHIVKSMKGSQGGYFLERDPKEITVAQIVEALEGTYDLEDEVDDGGIRRILGNRLGLGEHVGHAAQEAELIEPTEERAGAVPAVR